jgi:hypothetical protein
LKWNCWSGARDGGGVGSGARYFNRGFDLRRSRDLTLKERIEGVDRKFVAEISVGNIGCEFVKFLLRDVVFPVGVIACPLLKNALEAADGGRSPFRTFGVNTGGNSDDAVIGRDDEVVGRFF